MAELKCPFANARKVVMIILFAAKVLDDFKICLRTNFLMHFS